MKLTMTMEELREYANENNLFYSHVYGTKGTVYIYEDRYHYKRIGTVEVTDYRPIKNYKSLKPCDYEMAERTLENIQSFMHFVFKDGKLVDYGYYQPIGIPSKEEMENLTLFFDELRIRFGRKSRKSE